MRDLRELFPRDTPIRAVPGDRPGQLSPDAYNIFTRGQIGSSVALTRGQPGTKRQIVNISGPDHFSNALAIALVGPAAGFSHYALATIEWGSGGYMSSAEIDILQGICLSVVASSLRIFVSDDDDTVDESQGSTYVVGGFVGLQSTPKATPLQRSQNMRTTGRTAIANTASALFDVPAFAQSVQIARNPSDATNYMHAIAIEQLGDLAAHAVPLRVVGVNVVGSNQECPLIRLTNHTRALRITNIDTVVVANSVIPRLIYSLGLN